MKTIAKAAAVVLLSAPSLFAAPVNLFFDSKKPVNGSGLFDSNVIVPAVPIASEVQKEVHFYPMQTVLVEVQVPAAGLDAKVASLRQSCGFVRDQDFQPVPVKQFHVLPYPTAAQRPVYRVRGSVPSDKSGSIRQDRDVVHVWLDSEIDPRVLVEKNSSILRTIPGVVDVQYAASQVVIVYDGKAPAELREKAIYLLPELALVSVRLAIAE